MKCYARTTLGNFSFRFYFDLGTLYPPFGEYYFPQWYGKEQTPERLAKLEEAMKLLDGFLEPTGFAAGTKKMSLADLALYSTVSTMTVVGYDFTSVPNVQRWLDVMNETVPGKAENQEGLDIIKAWFSQD